MAGDAQQLTVEDWRIGFGGRRMVERSHCQTIWLLAKGHSTAEVAEMVALSPLCVNKLAATRRRGRTRSAIDGAAIAAPSRCSTRPTWRRCGSG